MRTAHEIRRHTSRKDCCIGINATIPSDVHIGENAVIVSCALVTKDRPAWTTAAAAAVAAKVVRSVRQ
ncbi:MAG: hypothetical protein K5928_03660 [Prevotella sp.]|nr:hypothetical protein [Prevotella sp.]